MPNKTDWDSYYKKPAKTASITRKITEGLLLRLMSEFAAPNPSILELGGANSCFYNSLKVNLNPKSYTIVDNNQMGIRKFQQSYPDNFVKCYNINLLDNALNVLDDKYDIIFSVGLVEHFSPNETAIVVQRHLEKISDHGIVIITYPTPTFLYKLTRGFIEWLGIWIFPDERPLYFDEIARSIPVNFRILKKIINWPIFLTQEVVVLAPKHKL